MLSFDLFQAGDVDGILMNETEALHDFLSDITDQITEGFQYSDEQLFDAAWFQLQWNLIGTAPSRLILTGQFSAAFSRILRALESM